MRVAQRNSHYREQVLTVLSWLASTACSRFRHLLFEHTSPWSLDYILLHTIQSCLVYLRDSNISTVWETSFCNDCFKDEETFAERDLWKIIWLLRGSAMPQTLVSPKSIQLLPHIINSQTEAIKLISRLGAMLVVINNESSDSVYSLRTPLTHKPFLGVSPELRAMSCVQSNLPNHWWSSYPLNEETKPSQDEVISKTHYHEMAVFTFKPLSFWCQPLQCCPRDSFQSHFSHLRLEHL